MTILGQCRRLRTNYIDICREYHNQHDSAFFSYIKRIILHLYCASITFCQPVARQTPTSDGRRLITGRKRSSTTTNISRMTPQSVDNLRPSLGPHFFVCFIQCPTLQEALTYIVATVDTFYRCSDDALCSAIGERSTNSEFRADQAKHSSSCESCLPLPLTSEEDCGVLVTCGSHFEKGDPQGDRVFPQFRRTTAWVHAIEVCSRVFRCFCHHGKNVITRKCATSLGRKILNVNWKLIWRCIRVLFKLSFD